MKKAKTSTKQLKAEIKALETKIDLDLFKWKFYAEELTQSLNFKNIVTAPLLNTFYSINKFLFPRKR